MKIALLIVLLATAATQAQTTNRWLTRPALLPLSAKNFVQYPESEALAKHKMEVTFFCDVNKEGKVTGFQPYRPADTSNAFVVAVRKALNAAMFEPAISHGEPVIVQFGGSVVFQIVDGSPTTMLCLNISDKPLGDRDYTGPQLIGGQEALLHDVAYPAIARAQHVDGSVDLAFDIDTAGIPRRIRIVNEHPAGNGFGESALAALRKARFIPAMYKGEPLTAPSTQRIDFDLQIIERYAPAKKKN
jgi:TonB family protein